MIRYFNVKSELSEIFARHVIKEKDFIFYGDLSVIILLRPFDKSELKRVTKRVPSTKLKPYVCILNVHRFLSYILSWVYRV